MTPTPFDEALEAEMATWEAAGLRRRLTGPGPGADFVSNDYLGLARHEAVIEGARAALAEHGASARASRLLGGGSPLDREVEEQARNWLGAEDALLLPSGYQANLAVISALARRGDVVLSDERNHASLIDAARLSRARVRVFRHNDAAHLDALLRASTGAHRRLVVTEGVFSMDGDRAPLGELASLCARHDAWLVVDEAHAAGILGAEGAGAWAAARVRGAAAERLVARIVTGGKALGASGALVVSSAAVREHLVNHARPFVFTTGASPATAGALRAAIDVSRGADTERERVLGFARDIASALDLPEPGAAVVPVVAGSSSAALALARSLGEEGLEVRAVRPPTVSEGSARLRVVCHATNAAQEVERLIESLRERRPAAGAVDSTAQHTHEPLVVVGTDTGVGKTVVSALLVRAAARRGSAVYWKPVQTGAECDTTEVRRLAGQAAARFEEPGCRFALPASPHEAARAEGGAVSIPQLDELFREHRRRLSSARDTLVVELAGGLLVPLTDDVTQADWLERHRPPLVLVARSGLGTLNHTLLSLEALAERGLRARALFLVGEPHASNRATLTRLADVNHVVEVPLFAELAPSALDAWLDAHPLDSHFDTP